MESAAIAIQRWYQGCSQAKKERELFVRKREAALVLQAHWRGWLVRHNQRSKAVREARLRVEKANCSAKRSNSLRERLPHILDTLLRSRYLSTAAEILNSLGE